MDSGQFKRGVASVVARCGVGLLVEAVLLLVDYHQQQPAEGQEHRGLGTQHRQALSAEQGVGSASAQCGRVDCPELFAQGGPQDFLQPAAECGFGGENQHLAAASQGFLRGFEIMSAPSGAADHQRFAVEFSLHGWGRGCVRRQREAAAQFIQAAYKLLALPVQSCDHAFRTVGCRQPGFDRAETLFEPGDPVFRGLACGCGALLLLPCPRALLPCGAQHLHGACGPVDLVGGA